VEIIYKEIHKLAYSLIPGEGGVRYYFFYLLDFVVLPLTMLEPFTHSKYLCLSLFHPALYKGIIILSQTKEVMHCPSHNTFFLLKEAFEESSIFTSCWIVKIFFCILG